MLVTGATSDAVAVFDRQSDGRLQFVQVLRNNVGGVQQMDAPRVLVTTPLGATTANQVFVGSAGDSANGVLGGLTRFDISASVPAPRQLPRRLR